MSTSNAKIAQKLEAIVVTMEILIARARDISTSSFESTMNSSKVQAAKNKLDEVETKVNSWHTLMQEAAATSDDVDVIARGGGGNGK